MVTDDVRASGGSDVLRCGEAEKVCKYFIMSREICKLICKVGFYLPEEKFQLKR